jgi:hypothetical protein
MEKIEDKECGDVNGCGCGGGHERNVLLVSLLDKVGCGYGIGNGDGYGYDDTGSDVVRNTPNILVAWDTKRGKEITTYSYEYSHDVINGEIRR